MKLADDAKTQIQTAYSDRLSKNKYKPRRAQRTMIAVIAKALGMVESSPEEKAKSAKTAMLFSRTNTLLSFPMLLSMVAAQNLY